VGRPVTMFASVGRERVRELAAGGAQLVEVLEDRQYELAHLPGAVHIPAWELSRARAGELDPSRPVVVYCFDTL
jgi:rhodanese-related sulfurtransferase